MKYLNWWKHLPTAELFGLAGNYRRLIRGNGPMGSAYQVGKAVVAVRLWRPIGSGPFHYLIDDDIRAGMVDESMPDGYRRRLEFAFGKSLEIVAFDRVESVITPSKRLADYYAGKGKRVFRLDPTWDVPEFPDLSHFDSGPLKVGFLGTRSHWADLNLLRGALEDPRRTWEFHHFLGKRGPDWPVNLSNIVAHAPMPWSSYRSAVKRIRFHVCVYPMLPTSFNLARSCNKLMEHAMVGAGSLYSSQVPFADHLVASDAGLLVADGDWTDTLRELALDRYHCRELALRGHRLGLETSIRARASQQELWATLARI